MKFQENLWTRFELQGRVQGVGCRAQVERKIRRLSEELGEPILGWVKNLESGAVEVVVQASASTVERIQQYLEKGLKFPVWVQSVSRENMQSTEIIDKKKTPFRVIR